MEQDVATLTTYSHVCSTCLSSDRNLMAIDCYEPVERILKSILMEMYPEKESISVLEHLVCWECVAIMKNFDKFKQKVRVAQERFWLSPDHTYLPSCLSTLQTTINPEFNKVFIDYNDQVVWLEPYTIQQTINVKNEQYDVAQVVRENIDLDTIDNELISVPDLENLDNTMSMSHIVVASGGDILLDKNSQPMLEVEVSPITQNKVETKIVESKKSERKGYGYLTDYMSEDDMLAFREQEKKKVQYASAAFKCELCIIGFYSAPQVEEHFTKAHRPKPHHFPCKVCYTYVEEKKLQAHVQEHYVRYVCRMCGHTERSAKLQAMHVTSHVSGDSDVIMMAAGRRRRNKQAETAAMLKQPKPGDLRKLLGKTTIEGYRCLECDMFFKTSKSRKNHVARCHREGLQCDHCLKTFVNKTTLATHLRLHEGPLPRSECPICHKMVRDIQLKYHVQRHQNTTRYECGDCDKIFSHLATFQAHLKYSRAHASEDVYKFQCPMCNKGYSTKEQMQDHFNYQHLGKTTHKCPICEKPIASKLNVERHMLRVHGANKREKPRNHICMQCGRGFTDKKALHQHEVIHSGDRPLSCDVCGQTFKQKASLYTHRKRVHKIVPNKKVVEYMDNKEQ